MRRTDQELHSLPTLIPSRNLHPLFEILEQAMGPEHVSVVDVLENYASLLRQTGREAEAARLATRAKTMPA